MAAEVLVVWVLVVLTSSVSGVSVFIFAMSTLLTLVLAVCVDCDVGGASGRRGGGKVGGAGVHVVYDGDGSGIT